MKITVLGATGGVGRQVVTQALADGDQVTAAVRDPSRLAAHPQLDVVETDVLDPAALAPLLLGRDAVVSSLGHRGGGPQTVLADGARSLVTAAAEAGVRRVLVVSASGAYTEKDDDLVTRAVAKPLVRLFLRQNFVDTENMEQVIRTSGLDWTIVRPPRLTDKPHTGRYRTGYDGVRGGYTVARADVADCLLSLIDRTEAVGRTVTVAN
ncbi:NAD(P)-dependent oxidoreductase [Cryptosporangium arvum]|uniref:NAD(P)-dependent oxidoreductase n=1 Tax=Cryptosporangium arvum TaxID=80871 RepID=UPI0004B415EE|nr:SDR family oxidoreductase [Cryptosporangium arvum]